MQSFQELILRLSEFWAGQGCVLQQPYDLEVGAGTMHPDTFLRVLGPEPWRVAYVQPSRRPADGRYGDNPFRLGKHNQFQVILKPNPADTQRLYIQSLEAIGIDLTVHDLRFEEDVWHLEGESAAAIWEWQSRAFPPHKERLRRLGEEQAATARASGGQHRGDLFLRIGRPLSQILGA